jgi:hypothetical protein
MPENTSLRRKFSGADRAMVAGFPRRPEPENTYFPLTNEIIDPYTK